MSLWDSDLALKSFSIATLILRQWTALERHVPGHALRTATFFVQDSMPGSYPNLVNLATPALAEGAWEDPRRMLSDLLVAI